MGRKVFIVSPGKECEEMTRSILFTAVLVVSAGFLSGQNDNSLIRKGNKQFKEGKFKEAEIDYRKAMEISPKSFRGEYNLGSSQYRQKNWEEAGRNYMNSAGKMKPNDVTGKAAAFHNLGNSLLKAEKYNESVEAYKQSLRLNPADEDTRYNLSYAMRKLQQQQQQQQKQDKNKDDKQDNKDQQNQNQPQDQKDQQDKQQQQKPQISKQDAERMLQALKNDEQKTIDKVKKQKAQPVQVQVEKDW
ncbi:MAG: tetratricopeptide repeat protein [Bacteroidota bacterium]